MYEDLIKADKERPMLEERIPMVWDRILAAQDEFQLAKANTLLDFLIWRFDEIKDK